MEKTESIKKGQKKREKRESYNREKQKRPATRGYINDA
jgi:hypothetical protein